MSGLLASDYGIVPDTAAALGSGALDPETRRRLSRPVSQEEIPKPAAPTSVRPPENSETNLTIARRQREMGENPSRDPNAQNPYSSAGGDNQIIDGTWVDLMNKYHPEIVQGKSRQEVLALKVNDKLNNEMAAQYDLDNAKYLASNGIAPTPNFINAAYRAGPQGALAIIQAARQNPGTLVKDVAPDMASPGNNGAGNLTVGQFLMNPYAHGPGAQDGNTPQQMFTMAQGNQILADMMREAQEGKERVAQIDKDYKPVDIGKPPPPPETDPLKSFGSLAGVFATLAASFSRTPAIAAMNGLAGAMDAAKKSDWETYKAQYDQFKTNSELALKAHDQHSADVRDALEMMQKNMAAGTAMLNATMALSNDEEMRKHMALGDYIAVGRLQMDRDKAAEDMRNNLPISLATAQLTAAMRNRDAAVQAGDPDAVKAADDLVKTAEGKVAEVKRAMSGGGTSSADISQPQEALIDGHPGLVVYNKKTRAFETPEGQPIQGNVSLIKGGSGGEQFSAVLQGVKRDNPDMPADKQTLLAKQRLSDVSGRASQQPEATYMRSAVPEIMREGNLGESEAKLEAARRWKSANESMSGNQRVRIEERVGMFDESNKEIDKAIDMLNKHILLAGLGGRARRMTETVGNILGSNTTDAADFRSQVQLLQLWGDRLLTHSDSRPLAAEKANISGIIRGLDAGDTTANTLSSMNRLKDIYTRLKALDEHELGASSQPAPAPNTQTISPMPNAPWSADPVSGSQ